MADTGRDTRGLDSHGGAGSEEQEEARNKPVSAVRSAKMQKQLEEYFSKKEYYEALQTYKVLYRRYLAQGREEDAMELLYEGAIKLFEKKQVCA